MWHAFCARRCANGDVNNVIFGLLAHGHHYDDNVKAQVLTSPYRPYWDHQVTQRFRARRMLTRVRFVASAGEVSHIRFAWGKITLFT